MISLSVPPEWPGSGSDRKVNDVAVTLSTLIGLLSGPYMRLHSLPAVSMSPHPMNGKKAQNRMLLAGHPHPYWRGWRSAIYMVYPIAVAISIENGTAPMYIGGSLTLAATAPILAMSVPSSIARTMPG